MSITPPTGRGRQDVSPSRPFRSIVLAYPATTLLALSWAILTMIAAFSFGQDQRRSGTMGCEMSWMSPTYHRLEWPQSEEARYSVYLYREGGLDPLKPVGRPVIFIPGNAGDFKQVRSIASSASRQFFGQDDSDVGNGGWGQQLDFFAAHFNEDFSAFHAATLDEQSKFLTSIVPHVLSSYGHLAPTERPTKVVFLGHSMGGIVARLAATSMDNTTIEAIVTMATPHQAPPLPFDYAMETIYTTINSASYRKPYPLLVSICGGVADTQIVSDSCALSTELVDPSDGFAVFTTAMPGVWTSVEHQAIVWCHQVRWRVARALLDMIFSSNRDSKLHFARKWLSDDPQSQRPVHASPIEVPVVAKDMTVLVHFPAVTEETLAAPPVQLTHCFNGQCSQPQWSVTSLPWARDTTYPFPFPGEGSRPQDSLLAVSVTGLPVEGSIRLEVPPQSKVVAAGAELDETVDGSWCEPRDDFNANSSSAASPMSTPPTHLLLRFTKPVLSSILAWRLEAETGPCAGHSPTLRYLASPTDATSATSESRFYPLANSSITVHSHISGSPFQSVSAHVGTLQVHIYQQPGCAVKRLRLAIDIPASLAKAVLRFRIALVAWCVGWAALLIAQMVQEYSVTGVKQTSLSPVIEHNLTRNLACASAILCVGVPVQGVLGRLGFASSGCLLFGLAHPLYLPLLIAAAVWSYGAVIVTQRLLVFGLSLAAKLSGSSNRVSGDYRKLLISRLVPACILLVLVKLWIPSRMGFVVLWIVQFTLVARSVGNQSTTSGLLISTLTLMTFLLPFHLPALAIWGRNIWARHGHPFPSDHSILGLLPVLLFVELCSMEQSLSTSRRLAQIVTLAVSGVSFLVAPRMPFLLLPTTNLAFIALSTLVWVRPSYD